MPPDGFSAAHAFTARFRRYPYRLKEESFRGMRLFRYPHYNLSKIYANKDL
jgi:hypothetical protein